jgi:hypothetical protein
MTPLFTKLNLAAHRTLHVLNAPASFEPELAALDGVRVLRAATAPVTFAIAFVATKTDVDRHAAALVAAAEGDALLWMAYPKQSSKRLRCEFNRDSGWDVLGAAGWEPVRQVAVDADWSALRFRKVDFIRAITRHPDGAISVAGKRRARGAG